MTILHPSYRILALAALLLLMCVNPGQQILYVPTIIFSGCFDYNATGTCTQETLAGSLGFPNKCFMSGDTVNMYFYSPDYSPGSQCQGKMIRIHVFRTDSTYVTTRDAIFHMYDCVTGQAGMSFETIPSDTVNPNHSLQMKIEGFSSTVGEAVHLTNIVITPRTLTGSMPLAITKGWISGSMGLFQP
jgi:hypothetical protein